MRARRDYSHGQTRKQMPCRDYPRPNQRANALQDRRSQMKGKLTERILPANIWAFIIPYPGKCSLAVSGRGARTLRSKPLTQTYPAKNIWWEEFDCLTDLPPTSSGSEELEWCSLPLGCLGLEERSDEPDGTGSGEDTQSLPFMDCHLLDV